jgi:hypothetical protein
MRKRLSPPKIFGLHYLRFRVKIPISETMRRTPPDFVLGTPRESKVVTFNIATDMLWTYDEEGTSLEEGRFRATVGGASPSERISRLGVSGS